ncbi:MAG: hypothetical protein AAGJ35_07175, partial [Myxococcota bacterium]
VRCVNDADCTDPRAPKCIQGQCSCANAQDCPEDFSLCVDQRCSQCRNDGDCPLGFPRCTDGACQLQRCNNNTQCTVKAYGKCLELGPQRVCVGCIQNEDCDTSTLRCDVRAFRCVEQ